MSRYGVCGSRANACQGAQVIFENQAWPVGREASFVQPERVAELPHLGVRVSLHLDQHVTGAFHAETQASGVAVLRHSHASQQPDGRSHENMHQVGQPAAGCAALPEPIQTMRNFFPVDFPKRLDEVQSPM
jgi:hypothetical protein